MDRVLRVNRGVGYDKKCVIDKVIGAKGEDQGKGCAWSTRSTWRHMVLIGPGLVHIPEGPPHSLPVPPMDDTNLTHRVAYQHLNDVRRHYLFVDFTNAKPTCSLTM